MALGGQTDQVFLGQELTQRRDYSEETAREADEEIRKILEQAYSQAYETLEHYRDQLDQLADILLEEEEIPGERVVEIIESKSTDADQEGSNED
jgi:cell division protease FtsH